MANGYFERHADTGVGQMGVVSVIGLRGATLLDSMQAALFVRLWLYLMVRFWKKRNMQNAFGCTCVVLWLLENAQVSVCECVEKST